MDGVETFRHTALTIPAGCIRTHGYTLYIYIYIYIICKKKVIRDSTSGEVGARSGQQRAGMSDVVDR